jgi:hypothetical protein
VRHVWDVLVWNGSVWDRVFDPVERCEAPQSLDETAVCLILRIEQQNPAALWAA